LIDSDDEKLSLNENQTADSQVGRRSRRSTKTSPEAVKLSRFMSPSALQSSLPSAVSTSDRRQPRPSAEFSHSVVGGGNAQVTSDEKVDGTRSTRQRSLASTWKPASPWPLGGKVYNVTNFGDSNACYADVSSDIETDSVGE
jgi:hypothetical protein